MIEIIVKNDNTNHSTNRSHSSASSAMWPKLRPAGAVALRAPGLKRSKLRREALGSVV